MQTVFLMRGTETNERGGERVLREKNSSTANFSHRLENEPSPTFLAALCASSASRACLVRPSGRGGQRDTRTPPAQNETVQKKAPREQGLYVFFTVRSRGLGGCR